MNRPKVLLLDEPLGALDLKLREEMQVELKAIQRQVGHHVRLRDPRPGGSPDHVGPDRGVQRGPDRAGRQPGRGLRASGAARSSRGSSARRTCCGRAAAQPLLGQDGCSPSGRRRSGWPTRPSRAGPDEHCALAARSREVVYAGSATRFLVDLDAGGTLMVLQQNLRTSSMDVMAYRESRVRLLWHRDHEFRVTEPGAG